MAYLKTAAKAAGDALLSVLNIIINCAFYGVCLGIGAAFAVAAFLSVCRWLS